MRASSAFSPQYAEERGADTPDDLRALAKDMRSFAKEVGIEDAVAFRRYADELDRRAAEMEAGLRRNTRFPGQTHH